MAKKTHPSWTKAARAKRAATIAARQHTSGRKPRPVIKSENGAAMGRMEFPLALIPERTPSKVRGVVTAKSNKLQRENELLRALVVLYVG